MNPQIKQKVLEELKARGMSQNQLAKALNIESGNLSRVMTGKSGGIPVVWQQVLDYLGLELVAQVNEESTTPKEETHQREG